MYKVYTAMMVALVWGCAGHHAPSAPSGRADGSEAVQGRGSHTGKWWDALPRKEWAPYERLMPDHPWFEVYRVLPGVYAIYEPHQFEEVISFLIVGQDKALLFDTGLGLARMRPVIAQLTSLDVLVVNSHSHYDHVGGNHEFDSIAAADDEMARRGQKGRSHDEVKEYVSGDWMARPIPRGVDASDYSIRAYALTEFVNDGDVIELGSRQLEVIRTPGHTPDSLCLLDRANKLLFTGDTFYLAPLYAHLDEANFADYHASVNRLAKLAPDVEHLLTAHNVPIADGDYLLKLKFAFDAIDNGTAQFERTDGALEYTFDGFSIITSE